MAGAATKVATTLLQNPEFQKFAMEYGDIALEALLKNFGHEEALHHINNSNFSVGQPIQQIPHIPNPKFMGGGGIPFIATINNMSEKQQLEQEFGHSRKTIIPGLAIAKCPDYWEKLPGFIKHSHVMQTLLLSKAAGIIYWVLLLIGIICFVIGIYYYTNFLLVPNKLSQTSAVFKALGILIWSMLPFVGPIPFVFIIWLRYVKDFKDVVDRKRYHDKQYPNLLLSIIFWCIGSVLISFSSSMVLLRCPFGNFYI